MFLAIASAVASGGGRELLHREHAVIYPVSPTTDHLGALLLAPLNIAWLLQAWILLGVTAYGVERRSLLAAEIGMLIWIVAATAVGAGRRLDGGGDPAHRRTASRSSARSAWCWPRPPCCSS